MSAKPQELDSDEEEEILPSPSSATPRGVGGGGGGLAGLAADGGGDAKEHRADPALRKALEALDEVTQNRPNLDSFSMDQYLARGGGPSADRRVAAAAAAAGASPSIRRAVAENNTPAAQIDCGSSKGLATPRDSAEAATLYAEVDAACFSVDLMMAALRAPKPAERRSRQSNPGRRARAASVERSSPTSGRPPPPPVEVPAHRAAPARGASCGHEFRGGAIHTPTAPPGPPPGSTARRRPCSYAVDPSRTPHEAA